MSIFSMIDHVEDGHKRMLDILEGYNLTLTDDELNEIKYGPLGDRFYPYIPRVNKSEQKDFKSLMTKERAGICSIRNGKKKWSKPPGSTLKTPDTIFLKYGKKVYKFSKDDVLMDLFTGCLRSLFNDYHQGQVNLIDSRQHDFKQLLEILLEEIKSITARREAPLSTNKILHLAYDLMALVFPTNFNSELNYEDDADKNRYKASRIKSIIK